MGLYASLGLGKGLSGAATSYAEGVKEAEDLKGKKLENDLRDLQVKKVQADVTSAGFDADFTTAMSKASSFQSVATTPEAKTPTPTGMGSTEGTPSVSSLKNTPTAETPKSEKSDTPGVEIQKDNEDKNIPKDDDEKTIVQDKDMVAVGEKEKAPATVEDWKTKYQSNMESMDTLSKIKKAKSDNTAKNLTKGMPGYNPVADEEEPPITSDSGTIEQLNTTLGKYAPIRKMIEDKAAGYEELAKTTKNPFYAVKAKEMRATYGGKITERVNAAYLQSFKTSVDRGDVGAVNTLASIMGLNGTKGQTFDYDKESGEWSVMNGDSSKAWSTKELSLALLDPGKFSELQQEIRTEQRKSASAVNQAVQQAERIQNATGGVSERVKQQQKENSDLGRSMGMDDGEMLIDPAGHFGVGKGGKWFVTNQELGALRNGTSDRFVKGKDGKAIVKDGKVTFERIDGSFVEIDSDYFEVSEDKDDTKSRAQALNYDPTTISISTTYITTGEPRGLGRNGNRQ